MAKKKQLPEEVAHSEAYVKDFFDMAVPSAIRFNVDHFICGDSYRSVWAIREYPPQTSDQALLARFGDKEAVTVHLYTRLVDGVEQRKILQNASRKNKLLANSNDLEDSVTGEGNLGDVVELLGELRKNREPLLHCAVFIELSAGNLDKLRELQSDVSMEMTREKISVDHLSMRQKEGFIACMPCGYNIFGTQYERVIPASAVANLFPFNYSGKTDKNGFYLGKDKFGTNIIADFDQRADDKTNSNILILGNSGQGKSYLLKLILTNTRMSGKSVICLDAEQEYEDLCNNLGGCYIDLMSGAFLINPLEPKEWSDNASEADADSPEAFRKSTRLSQHISFLKDFFRVYKDFDDAQIDALEILLSRLYAKFGITDNTDYDQLKADDYPVMADLYAMVESEYQRYEKGSKSLFTEDLLRELCLGLNSMCVGAESKFFNGHTNISDDRFLVFGVKGLMEANMKLKNAMLFNILSYMNHKLLTKGNTAASIDELYLFLTNMTAIEYIRNASKRVRKKDSSILLASQNIEDFLLPEIKEMTKPLFSIPTHQFLFNGGNVNPRDYMDALQLEESEYDLIKYSAYLPKARQILRDEVHCVAELMIKGRFGETENGSWVIGFDDIKEHFDLTVSPTNGIGEMLLGELEAQEEVGAVIATEDCFEISEYLQNAPEDASASEKLLTVFSLMGCNLEDVHLLDADEEHEVATIVELNRNTLTDEGKRDWSDVLAAKVERIYDGVYGTQIEVSGCLAHRLRDFSFALAGYCSEEQWSKWFNEPTTNTETLTMGGQV